VNNFEPGTKSGGLFNGGLFDARTYTNPNIAGLTFSHFVAGYRTPRRAILCGPSSILFSTTPKKNGKWVELVLIPGFATPAWALQGAQTATFSVIYGPGKGENLLLPLPWDPTYLQRWFEFLKAVSARYGNRPSFLKIAADGPTSVTAEMSLPNAPADLCTWVGLGYSSERLVGAWKQVFAQYRQIFPRQYFSLALYPPLPIVSSTRCENGAAGGVDHRESARVTALIAAAGADNYPKKFVLQENGMTAAKDNTGQLWGLRRRKKLRRKVVIGYQTGHIGHAASRDMGDADGATALQKSLQRGLDAKAQFLEVWEPDVLSSGRAKRVGRHLQCAGVCGALATHEQEVSMPDRARAALFLSDLLSRSCNPFWRRPHAALMQ